MHEAKSVNTQSIKNLRPFVRKVRLRFVIKGVLAEISKKM